MMKRFQISNGALAPSDSPEAQITAFIEPDTSERKRILETLDLDEHALASALDPDEVSRIEFDGERIFVIWKLPKNFSGGESFFFDVASVGFVLYRGQLTIISLYDIDLTRSAGRMKPAPVTSLDVLLGLLLGTVHHYIEHLRIIKTIARELEHKVSMSMENRHLLQMFNLSESLVYYLNAVSGNGSVITKLRNHAEKQRYPTEVLDLMYDLAIENDQCFKQAEIYSTVLSGLMDARGNLINNNMNVLLKKLTIINVVFLPLNLIASMLGMSEFTMMTQKVDWRISYSLLTLAMIGVGWATAVLVRRLGNDTSGRRAAKSRSPK